jgi:hypothetical protein
MYDESLPSALDWDMWIRVSKYYDFRCVDEALVTTWYLPVTTHYRATTAVRGMVLLLDKHSLEYEKYDKRSQAKHYFYAGIVLCADDDLTHFNEGRQCLRKAAIICPLNLKYDLLSLASLFGPTLFHNHSLRRLLRPFNKSVLRIA